MQKQIKMKPNRVDFLNQIKEIQKNYPDLNKHQMDEYRCKYYGDIIDLYHAYTLALERELRQSNNNHHVITNKKFLENINNLTKPNKVELKEPELPEYQR